MLTKKPALIAAAVVVVIALLVGAAVAFSGDGDSALKPGSPSPTPSSSGEATPDGGEPSADTSTEPSADPSASPTAAPTTPAVEPPPAVSGTKQLFYTNEGGGPVPYVPVACMVNVTIKDDSPSEGDKYEAMLTDSKGKEVESAMGAFAPVEAIPTTLQIGLPCDQLEDGAGYKFAVEEKDGDFSFSEEFTHQLTGHPANIKNTTKLVDGEWSNYVGRPTKIKFTGGEWEPGTKFTTRIWTSKTKDFAEADHSDNIYGRASIFSETDAASPTLSFVPLERDKGRYVWISIMGQAPGKAPYIFTFEPELVRG